MKYLGKGSLVLIILTIFSLVIVPQVFHYSTPFSRENHFSQFMDFTAKVKITKENALDTYSIRELTEEGRNEIPNREKRLIKDPYSWKAVVYNSDSNPNFNVVNLHGASRSYFKGNDEIFIYDIYFLKGKNLIRGKEYTIAFSGCDTESITAEKRGNDLIVHPGKPVCIPFMVKGYLWDFQYKKLLTYYSGKLSLESYFPIVFLRYGRFLPFLASLVLFFGFFAILLKLLWREQKVTAIISIILFLVYFYPLVILTRYIIWHLLSRLF